MPWWLLPLSAFAAQPKTVCTDGQGTCDYPTLAQALEADATDILLLAGDHAAGAEVVVPNTTISGEDGAVIRGRAPQGDVQLDIAASNVTVANVGFEPVYGDSQGSTPIRVQGTPQAPLVGVRLERLQVAGWDVAGGSGGLEVDEATVDLVDSTFDGCWGLWGGAVFVRGGSTVTITGSTFVDNRADQGGAVFADGSTLTVSTSTFTGNATFGAFGFGGAVSVQSGTDATFTDVEFVDNSAMAGAGIDAWQSGPVTLDTVLLRDQKTGQGVYVEGDGRPDAQLAVKHSTFEGNLGGGIEAWDTRRIDIDDTWFCGDGTPEVELAPVALQRTCQDGCTIANSAFLDHDVTQPPWRGGGVWLAVPGGPLTVTHSSFLRNANPSGSALALDVPHPVDLQNLLLAYNQGSEAVMAGTGTNTISVVDVGSWGNPDGDVRGAIQGQIEPLATEPLLLPHPTRCPTVPAVPVCDAAENDRLFEAGMGVGTADLDEDGVVDACDETPLGQTDPPSDTETDPGTTLGPGAGGPTDEFGVATFLLGGGGCGCTQPGPPVGALGGLAVAGLRLGQRRTRSR